MRTRELLREAVRLIRQTHAEWDNYRNTGDRTPGRALVHQLGNLTSREEALERRERALEERERAVEEREHVVEDHFGLHGFSRQSFDIWLDRITMASRLSSRLSAIKSPEPMQLTNTVEIPEQPLPQGFPKQALDIWLDRISIPSRLSNGLSAEKSLEPMQLDSNRETKPEAYARTDNIREVKEEIQPELPHDVISQRNSPTLIPLNSKDMLTFDDAKSPRDDPAAQELAQLEVMKSFKAEWERILPPNFFE